MNTSRTQSIRSRLANGIVPVFGLLLFALSGLLLHHELEGYHPSQIMKGFNAIPFHSLVAAFAIAMASYAALTVHDTLAMLSIGRKMNYSRTALASFVAATFSNNMGFGLLSGGSVRFRLYSAWDVSIEELARVMVFFSVTLWLGFGLLAGTVLTTEPGIFPTGTLVSGILLLVLVGAYVLLSIRTRHPIQIRGVSLTPTAPRYLPAQLFFSMIHWGLAGFALYLLMPPDPGLSFGQFLSFFLLAFAAGIVSRVPGGIGVFESLILFFFGNQGDLAQTVAALLAYRMVYYLFPLLTGMLLMSIRALYQRWAGIKASAATFTRWSALITPPLLSFATFAAGVILLISGAMPPEWSRFHILTELLPLPLIEGSHFLSSVVGMGLIVLARGIQNRVDAAYITAVAFLGAGLLFSLLKGWDYEEAFVMVAVLILFIPARRYFSRSSLMISQTFSPGWFAAVIAVLAGIIWLTVFAHSHVQYRGELWWQFEINKSAPRSMRALVGAIIVLILSGFAALYSRRPRRSLKKQQPINWDTVTSIVKNSPCTNSNLVFLNDKRVLLGPSEKSFLMYGVAGRNFVAMGDPVGVEEDWKPLVWNFRQLADSHGANVAFFDVRTETLPLYLDLGLTVLKLGEEARVPLPTFDLVGASRKGLRHLVNKLDKLGLQFSVMEKEEIGASFHELEQVSSQWLQDKNTREKAFSLGRFSQSYLENFPLGVVRQEGRIIAFSNLWVSDTMDEVSIDLMRQTSDAPQRVMDYLFIQLMLWAKEKGYGWFNMGMAPLAGLDEHPMAPLWNRAGAFIFQHGEYFYNFQGLRTFKEKFSPVWVPKYLATPGGLSMASVLSSLATLSSGGLAGVVAK